MILTLFYHKHFIFSSKVILCTSCVFNSSTVFVISEWCFNEDSSSKEISGQQFSLRHFSIWDIQQWKFWYFFPFSVLDECYWNLQMLHCNCKAISLFNSLLQENNQCTVTDILLYYPCLVSPAKKQQQFILGQVPVGSM